MNPNWKLPELKEIWFDTLGWQPNERQQEQFQKLYAEILLANQKQNLTRITTPIDFWEKHLWDSIAGIKKLELPSLTEQPLAVIDIGTGAGFPGIPVAIAQPFWSVTLLDSTRKKITFLKTAVERLNLQNAQTLIGRVEKIGQEKEHRETYDLALIRAVGQASVCAEYALPLLKIGGIGVLYRGHWSEEDTLALEKAVMSLGGKIESLQQFTTPISNSIRHCIYLRKHSPTSIKFPRNIGIPNQEPL